MAKIKKEELTGTKAILFADGNANKFQEFKGELFKEHLQESDYAESKSVHTSESLSLNKGESNDVITIEDQQVSILVFEDGSVYDVTKGFRTHVSEKVQSEIDSTNEIIKDEAALKAKAVSAKKVTEAKVTEPKTAKVAIAKEPAQADTKKEDKLAVETK